MLVEAGWSYRHMPKEGQPYLKRSAHLPQVPTLTELGYPDLDFSNWLGTAVAPGVPADIVDKINAATLKAAAAPGVRDRMTAVGFEPNTSLSSAQLLIRNHLT